MKIPVAAGRGDHGRITPTARMMAYCRSFTDIPYAEEVCEALGCEETARELYGEDFDLTVGVIGPYAEARYKCLDRFISAYDNVLELAVGTSIGRGLSICGDPNKMYIGTDLREMIADSRALLAKIDGNTRANHRLEPANVLSCEELNAAAGWFGARRNVLVMHEGLLGYLSQDEHASAADNIRSILERYGGQWVTPDMIDRETRDRIRSFLAPEINTALERVRHRIEDLTARKLTSSFENREQIIGFLNELGFRVNHYPMVDDLGHVSSMSRRWRGRERASYEQALMQYPVWVMSLQ